MNFNLGSDQPLPERHRPVDPLLRRLSPVDLEPLGRRPHVISRSDANHAEVDRTNVAAVWKFCKRYVQPRYVNCKDARYINNELEEGRPVSSKSVKFDLRGCLEAIGASKSVKRVHHTIPC